MQGSPSRPVAVPVVDYAQVDVESQGFLSKADNGKIPKPDASNEEENRLRGPSRLARSSRRPSGIVEAAHGNSNTGVSVPRANRLGASVQVAHAQAAHRNWTPMQSVISDEVEQEQVKKNGTPMQCVASDEVEQERRIGN